MRNPAPPKIPAWSCSILHRNYAIQAQCEGDSSVQSNTPWSARRRHADAWAVTRAVHADGNSDEDKPQEQRGEPPTCTHTRTHAHVQQLWFTWSCNGSPQLIWKPSVYDGGEASAGTVLLPPREVSYSPRTYFACVHSAALATGYAVPATAAWLTCG